MKNAICRLSGAAMAVLTGLTGSAALAQGTYDWSGAYGGFALGYSSADASVAGTVPVVSLFGYSADGGLAGGYVGYLWQTDRTVYGIEADIEAWNLSGNDGGAGGVADGFDGNWLASVRGRLGYASGRTLFYGTLGVQFADLDVVQSSVPPAASVATGFSETGWTVGIGFEHAVSDQVSIGVEYRHIDIGAQATPTNAVSGARTHDLNGLDTIRFRVSYRF